MRAFDEVPKHVLAIAGAVLEPPKQPDHLRMDVGDADLRHRVLAGAADAFLDLGHRPLVDLFDPCGMDAPVLDELLEGHPRGLATYRVEAAQHDRLGRV